MFIFYINLEKLIYVPYKGNKGSSDLYWSKF